MAIVKLKLRESKQGFQVDLTAKQLDIETEGFLPPLPPQLESSFNNWQLAYRQIDAVRSVFSSHQVRLSPKGVTKYSSAEYTTSVKESLNQWLNSADSRWLPVRDRLIAIAQQLHQRNEEIRIIIDAKDVNLRRLPWQEWKLFEEYYPQVEIALIAAKNTYKYSSSVLPKSSKIRVLVAVGRSDGINTKNDLEVIKDLEQHGAEVVCLMQPNRRELCNALWDDEGYHIFIFTGHSGSREDGHIGWIELNDNDSLSIEEFKEALKHSINQGLQLAIFNSCDGLGLASQLAQLHLPRCIVMREPVPDKVAVEFLKYFFEEFTGDRSLSKALNRARKRLEHFNFDFPGAIWLPTICVAANVKLLTWKSLNSGNIPQPVELIPDKKSNVKLFVSFGLIGLLISCIAVVSWNLFSKSGQDSIKTPSKQLTFTTLTSVSVPSGTFRYGGSTSWEPLREKIERKIRKAHPKFQLMHQGAIGSGQGIKRLLNDKLENGKLDFALSSRNLKASEKQSNIDNFQLREIPVAIDGIAIAVNHQLQIKGLTIQNLKDIYTGKVTNWQQIGGENLEIVPFSRKPTRGGTPEFFVQEVLDNEEFAENVQFIDETTKNLRQVNQQPGAIYYASASEVVTQCSVKTLPIAQSSNNFVSLDTQKYTSQKNCEEEKKRGNQNHVNVENLKTIYPSNLTRTVYVIYKQTNSGEEAKATKAGKAYIELLQTDEGKKIINEAGFIPIQ
ncbi:MAG: substrate-binding domain-containing protein [Cyanobacteria bacterium P01_D01_bin.50]